MNIGLFVIGDYRDESIPYQERFDQLLAEAVLAEELGFDSVWFAEHHFSQYGLISNILTFAAAVAQRTSRIRIGTAVVVTPFIHPLRLAEEAAMVDVMTGGRLELGLGRGYQPLEFSRFNLRMEDSAAMFAEGVEILEQALTGEAFEHTGRFWNFESTRVFPVPIQRPVPLWFASASPTSFERFGQERRRILASPNFTPPARVAELNETYIRSYVEAGGEPASIRLPLLKPVYVGADPVSAREIPRQPVLDYFALLGQLIADDDVTHEGYEMYSKGKERLHRVAYDRLLDDGVVFGTAEEVADQILAHRALHVSEFMAMMDFGGLPFKEVQSSMERLATVLPHLRSADPPPALAAAKTAIGSAVT